MNIEGGWASELRFITSKNQNIFNLGREVAIISECRQGSLILRASLYRDQILNNKVTFAIENV